MTEHTDQDLMAPLFVSNEGEITTFPEATSEDDWIDRMDGTVAVRFYRLLVHEPVTFGILRLIRERDEAEKRLDYLRAMLVDLVKELPSESPLSTSLYRVLFPKLAGAPDD